MVYQFVPRLPVWRAKRADAPSSWTPATPQGSAARFKDRSVYQNPSGEWRVPWAWGVEPGACQVLSHVLPDRQTVRRRALDAPYDCFMAGAYGNRTHQEPVSRPLTGFEDRAEHQLLTRSRMRQDTSEHDANRRNPLFYRTKRSCTSYHPILPSRQNPTHSVSIRPLRASPALPNGGC